MKALIVGAGGQVGQALRACAPADALVTALDRNALDVTDKAAVLRAVERHTPDIIFNSAAYTAVDKAENDAENAYLLNQYAPAYLANAARATGAHLVHISTDYVFDGTRCQPYRPADDTNPLSVYGASKLAGERAVLDIASDALIVRTAWIYSIYNANFVKTMLRVMTERPEVRVVVDQIGTPTHADSLARALWILAGRRAQGICHYTDAGAASWYDFAVAIQEEAVSRRLLDKVVPVTPIGTADFPTPARRPSFSLLEKGATYQLTGPAHHWRTELRFMLDALKDRLNG